MKLLSTRCAAPMLAMVVLLCAASGVGAAPPAQELPPEAAVAMEDARSQAEDAARAEAEQAARAAAEEAVSTTRGSVDGSLDAAWDSAVKDAQKARPFAAVSNREWALIIGVGWLLVQWRITRRRAARLAR